MTRAPRIALVAWSLAVAACAGAPRAAQVDVLPDRVDPGERAERYELRPTHTTVQAGVTAAATFTIDFAIEEGVLELTPAAPEKSRVSLVVDMKSASSSPGAVADIAKEKFLHVEDHPTAVFASRTITSRPDGTYELIGELTLHGVTHGLRMPATLDVGRCRITSEVRFSVDRRRFDIVSEGSLDGVVSDEVEVRIALDLPRRGGPQDCPPRSSP